MTPRRRARLSVTTATITALVVLAGCADDPGSEVVTTPPTATAGATSPAGSASPPEGATTGVATPTEMGTPTGMATPTGTGAPTATAPGAATVAVGSTDLGDILVDADGRTLYVFDNDSEGVSNCTDDCLANWPPLLAEGDPVAGEGVSAELGTITRDDGETQVTVGGMPLYHFAGDAAPGDVNGQAIGDVWWVVGPDGQAVTGEAAQPAEPGYGDDY